MTRTGSLSTVVRRPFTVNRYIRFMKPVKGGSLCKEQNFDKVYLDQVRLLFNYTYYRCGDKQTAEDVIQEAFVELWKNCHRVSEEKARAYLFRVVKNKLINLGEKKRVRLEYAVNMGRRVENRPETPEYTLEKEEFRKRLEIAISNLPHTQREVFLLNRVEGLRYREIADLLGISQKAVEKRMQKALMILRELHKNI